MLLARQLVAENAYKSPPHLPEFKNSGRWPRGIRGASLNNLHIILSRFPRPFDELHHQDFLPLAHRTQRLPQSSRGFPFSVARVDDNHAYDYRSRQEINYALDKR